LPIKEPLLVQKANRSPLNVLSKSNQVFNVKNETKMHIGEAKNSSNSVKLCEKQVNLKLKYDLEDLINH